MPFIQLIRRKLVSVEYRIIGTIHISRKELILVFVPTTNIVLIVVIIQFLTNYM